MRLFVVRHARAFELDPSRWPDDSQRPLTRGGEREFRRLAKAIRRWQDAPSAVLASPWVRAWHTAEILHKCARWPEPTASPAMAGDAPHGVDGIVEAARQWAGAVAAESSLAVVGHEPVLSELVERLLGSGPGSIRMTKGAVAVLEVTGFASGQATLRALIDPSFPRRR